MKCKNCGGELKDGEVYCPHCGENLKDVKINTAVSQSATFFKKEIGRKEKRIYIDNSDDGIVAGERLMLIATILLFVFLAFFIIVGLTIIFTVQIFYGLGFLISGVLLSVIDYLFMYGFGILIKKVSLIEQKQNRKE